MWFYYLVHYVPWLLFLAPAALWVYARVHNEQRWRWVMGPLAVSAIGLSAIMLLAMFPTAASNGWCASRLSTPIAWTLGDDLYPSPGEGPALVRMYGPVYALIYTPTALAWSPTAALLMGALINLAMFVGSVAWLMRRCGRNTSMVGWLAVVATFALGVAIACPLLDIAALVTVDAPALALAAGACAVVVGDLSDRFPSTRRAIACGLLASACIWTKQTMAPLVLALAIYLLLIASPRAAAAMLLTVAFSSSIVLLTFGADRMLYHMLVVPSLHPTNWPWLGRRGALLRGLWFAWWECKIVAWMALAALVLRLDVPRRAKWDDIRSWARRSPWLLTLLVALVVVPTTMLAYVKLAGNRNNVAPMCFFGLLTVATALLGLFQKSPAVDAPLPPRARIALMAVSVLLIILPWAQRREMLRTLPGLHEWTRLGVTEQQRAFAYLTKHPGQAYFPQFPLASLLAEKKVRHFDEAILDFHRAGIPLAPRQLRSGLPQPLREILFLKQMSGPIPALLPEFDQVGPCADLPGFVRVTRDANRSEQFPAKSASNHRN
jgi:hypothetical protein